MVIAKALVAILKNSAPVTAVVANRIYPALVTQGDPRPQIVYDCEDPEPDVTLDGPSGLVRQTVAVSCLSLLYSTTDTLANKVRVALNGVGGYGQTFAGMQVSSILWTGESESNESIENLPELMIYVKTVEFSIQYQLPS